MTVADLFDAEMCAVSIWGSVKKLVLYSLETQLSKNFPEQKSPKIEEKATDIRAETIQSSLL
jgi:hypothetical protein